MLAAQKETQKNRKPNHFFKEAITVMNELRNMCHKRQTIKAVSVQNLYMPRHMKETWDRSKHCEPLTGCPAKNIQRRAMAQPCPQWTPELWLRHQMLLIQWH